MKWEALAPAKFNPFLSVGPPDQRGYHPLRTVFQAISLADTLRLEVASEDSFRCNESLPERNTVTKSLSLSREYADLPPLSIELEKRIPTEAGLGGGSSDAAALLRILLRIPSAGFDTRSAKEVAAAVGADVPFFMMGGRAYGEGYGERLTPLPEPEAPEHLVLIKPPVGVSTPQAYGDLDQLERDWIPYEENAGWYNDFEKVMPSECQLALELLQQHGTQDAVLAGSGSTVVGRFLSEDEARKVAALVPPKIGTAWAVRTLSRDESLWISSF